MTVKLFHGTASVCSAKVRLAFEEKGIAYEGHERLPNHWQRSCFG